MMNIGEGLDAQPLKLDYIVIFLLLLKSVIIPVTESVMSKSVVIPIFKYF